MSILANILLVVNVFVCIALIALVLMQQSEGGALGMGGGGGGPSGFLTTRGAGDLLTRTTWILAFVFFGLAMTQTLIIGRAHGHGSIVDRIDAHSLDLSGPTKSGPPPPVPANPGIQAPLPTVQAPPPVQPGAKPAADPLSILAAPSAAPASPAGKKP